MDTHEIANIVGRDKKASELFLGVFAGDQLPTKKINDDVWLLITNCCASNLPGLHWVGIFGNKDGIEFFDSYGLPPDAYPLVKLFIKSQKPKLLRYNSVQIQNVHSQACGWYALFFVFNKSRGRSLETILKALLRTKLSDYMIQDLLIMTYVNINMYY